MAMATVRIGDLRRNLAAEIDERLAALRRSGYVTIGDVLAASVEPTASGEILPPNPLAGEAYRRWVPLDGGGVGASGGERVNRRWIPF